MSTTKRFLPALMILAGAAIATPACAAQVYSSAPRGVYVRDFDRVAYDNGFREGLEEGRNDARKHRDFSLQRHDEYRDADQGYRREYGDRDFYRRSYRQGFEVGYREAYGRDGRSYDRDERVVLPPPPVAVPPPAVRYESNAARNGYRDGIDAGREDARDRHRFDPVRAKRYREGDHDYDRRYGSRDDYKREYRSAFERGYDEGFRQVR